MGPGGWRGLKLMTSGFPQSAGLRPAAASKGRRAWQFQPVMINVACCGTQSRAPPNQRLGSPTFTRAPFFNPVEMELARDDV